MIKMYVRAGDADGCHAARLRLRRIDAELLGAVDAEIRLLSLADCPFIPKLYKVYRIGRSVYLLMEYFEGQSLTQMHIKDERPGLVFVISVGIRLCGVLDYLQRIIHGGIVHLDIQPDNIIIAHDGLRLIDFGSVYFSDVFDNCGICYRTTRGFAAPEIYMHGHVDQRTDIFSIGRVLIYLLCKECISNKNPFEFAWNNMDAFYEKEKAMYYKLLDIIDICTKYNMHDRFENVALLSEQLYLLLDGKPLAL